MPRPSGMLYLGIDPGKAGGVAAIGAQTYTWSMPETERDIWQVFDGLVQNRKPVVAVIEAVHAMPGQGVTAMFTFGRGYGSVRMALIAAGIPFEEVHPRTWQKALGVTPRKKTESKDMFKKRLRAKAQQLFPKQEVTLKTADALLLALYCKRLNEGNL